MAKKTEKIQIGSTQYTVTHIGADDGSMLFKKLLSTLGPAIGELIPALKAGDDAEALILGLILRLTNSLPNELFLELREHFKRTCKYQASGMQLAIPLDTQGVFDDHFAGEYGELTKWFMACMKFNFTRSFLDKLGSAHPAAERA